MKRVFTLLIILVVLTLLPIAPTDMFSTAFADSPEMLSVDSQDHTLRLPSSTRIIESEAFAGLKTARTIELPDGIQEIRSCAFANSSITTINLPSSLSFIADDAFKNCPLESVYAAEGSYAYNWALTKGYIIKTPPNPATDFEYSIINGDCTIKKYIGSNSRVVIPNTIENCPVVSIGSWAFNNSTVESVVIPKSVKAIEKEGFRLCRNLKTIEISEGVEKIGSLAFANCSKLTEISIPKSVTFIDSYSFGACLSLKRINVSADNAKYCDLDGVLMDKGKTRIMQYPSARSVGSAYSIPETVNRIDEGAFGDCRLTRIVCPDALTEIGKNAFSCAAYLEEIVMPKSLSSLCEYVFSDCINLKSVVIPDGITVIKDGAFQSCRSLTRIVLPDSVTNIDGNAFNNCDKLTIYGISGSYAESYATQNGIPFIAIGLSNLNVNENIFIAGEDNTALFTVEGSRAESIYLYSLQNNNPCGLMLDDGTNGDAVADDGIYSLSINITADKAKTVQYYAAIGSLKSNTIELLFFEDPSNNTEMAKQEVLTVRNGIAEIDNHYGYEINTKLDSAEVYAESLVNEGLILSYSRTDNAVFMRNKYGLTIAYIPEVDYLDLSNDRSMQIITFQPCLSTYENILSNYMTFPDVAAQIITRYFDNYSFSDNSDNASVTLSKIRGISANSVVLWHGHGKYYNDKIGSILLTGEDFNLDAWLWNPVYWWDCVQERIVHDWTGKVRISGRYIDKYCGDMTNSMIYLGACQSGYDSTLADSFLSKGASAVIANSDSIITPYNLSMIKSTIEYMCRINTNTANYYTLEEALSAAFNDNGANDVIWAQNNEDWITNNTNWNYNDLLSGSPAWPSIFGGEAAKAYRFRDAYGNLSGRVIRADDKSTAISNADIMLFVNDVPYKSETTNNLGNYSIGYLPPRQYKLRIDAPGFVTFTSYATINVNETTYMETFLMVEGQEGQRGTASGVITNALTGVGLDGVLLEVRQGWNNMNNGSIIASIILSSSGQYSFELPIGNYTVKTTKDGFITSSFNIIVQPYINTGSQNHALSPTISNEQYRIKLTWGDNPRDLDSHLQGQFSNGEPFHVYYSNMNALEGNTTVCILDVDDTDSYGPEVVTLKPMNANPYYYYVHRYAGSGTITSSNARVELYKGAQLIRTFNVPSDLGAGDYWNVFAIKNGGIVVNNTATNIDPDTSYAN